MTDARSMASANYVDRSSRADSLAVRGGAAIICRNSHTVACSMLLSNYRVGDAICEVVVSNVICVTTLEWLRKRRGPRVVCVCVLFQQHFRSLDTMLFSFHKPLVNGIARCASYGGKQMYLCKRVFSFRHNSISISSQCAALNCRVSYTDC